VEKNPNSVKLGQK